MFTVLLLALTLSACAGFRPPPTYPDPQRVLWYANEVAVSVNMLQHVAIELNKIQVCEAGATTTSSDAAIPVAAAQVCHPLLSEDNVRAVGETTSDIRASLRRTPEGWRAIVATGLDRLIARLDNAGQVKLSAYIQAARFTIQSGP